jgi:hypothetical protein
LSRLPFSLDGSLANKVPNIFPNAAAGLVVNPSEHLGGCLVKQLIIKHFVPRSVIQASLAQGHKAI